MYRFCACALVLPALLLGNTAAAQDTLTYGDIAGRLYDLERLAEPPTEGERGGAWTSADRGGRYDAATDKYVNWGANGDGGGFMRREGDSFVAAEIDGPGVLWRFWSARAAAGHVKIFIDGNETPVVDRPFHDFFAEFEKPYPNLAMTLSRGRNRFIPIPFQKSCKVTLDQKWGMYFHITYAKFPEGTKVESFQGYDEKVHAALAKADAVWGARGEDPHKVNDGAKVVRHEMTLAGGGKSELKIDGAKAIRAIKIRPALPEDVTAQEDALREMTLAIKWDGQPTPGVWAPLGDFFATSPGVNLYKALPMGMTDDGFYCYWYMPFEKGAVIELANDGKEPRQLEIEVETAPLAKPAGELLRFHAWWHGDDYTGVDKECFTTGDRRPDWPLLVTKGRGRYVGMTQHIWKFGGWWGEGDEKFFVDGEKYPSTIGTGSEDYIGYAWAAGPPFITFQSALACNTHLLPDAQKDTSVNRFHVCDDVPFMKSFEGVIEKYVPNYDRQGKPCLFDTTVYWYAMPGSKSPYKPLALEGRVHPRPTVKTPPPPKPLDPDAIEGESLKVVRCDGGRHWIQAMGGYLGGKWSGDKHLIWTSGKQGQSIAIEFDVPEGGEREIKLRLTKARDYGIFQLYLDEKKVGEPIDLYDPDVVPADATSLGRHQLTKGKHTLRAEAIGCNEKAKALSVGTYLFGLDYMTVK